MFRHIFGLLNFKIVLFHVSWVCCFSIFLNSICPAGLTLLALEPTYLFSSCFLDLDILFFMLDKMSLK